MRLIKFTFVLSLMLFACNTNEVVTKENNSKQDPAEALSTIDPLDIDPGATIFSIDASSADTIFAETGSTILFQPNSFVDKKGNPIKGKVDVEWQEFHTLGEIITSGIPMKYDSSGVAYDLESGGMFTINAKYKGEEVKFAEGKSAEVNLASIQDTPCYNFYKLDEKSGDWDYKTTAIGIPSEAAQSEEQVKPKPTIFDMQLNTKNFPELQKLDLVGWKCLSEISAAEKRWIGSRSTRVRIAEKVGENYILEAKNKVDDEEKSLKVKVAPYTSDEALADTKVNALQMKKDVDEVVEYAKKLAEGKLIRSINITGFGTYNWDIIYKRENSLPLAASFEYPNGTNPSLVTLRLISPDENVVVRYEASGDKNFSFDPAKRNILIGILPNNELVSVSNAEFDPARNKPRGASHTFKLKKTGIKLKSPEDIMSHLNKLI